MVPPAAQDASAPAPTGSSLGFDHELAEISAFVCAGAFYELLRETDQISRDEKQNFFEGLRVEDLHRRGIRPPDGITIEICAGPHQEYVAPGRPILIRVHKELPDGVSKLTVAFDHHEGHSWLPRSGM